MTIKGNTKLWLTHNCVEDTVGCSLEECENSTTSQLSEHGSSLPETSLGIEFCHVPQMPTNERRICTQYVPNLKGPHVEDVTSL